jgi:hypothetical protein
MAETRGLVEELTLTNEIQGAVVRIGSTPASTEILSVTLKESDNAVTLGAKRNAINLLAAAQRAGFPVRVEYIAETQEVLLVETIDWDISPCGPAVREDLYSISGSGFPANARLVFDSATRTVDVAADMSRPHLVVIESLPSQIPLGPNTVQVVGTGFTSNAVPINVGEGPGPVVRALYGGRSIADPFTVAFIASPAFRGLASSPGGPRPLAPDPILGDRAAFVSIVMFALQNLFTMTEELLRHDDIDSRMRLVVIFDSELSVEDDTALVEPLLPDLTTARPDQIRRLVAKYGEAADVVFAVTASGGTRFPRGTAWWSDDSYSDEDTPFVFDDRELVYPRGTDGAGCVALLENTDRHGMTPLHEFGHAVSNGVNGQVVDLYVDQDNSGGIAVNKKRRASAGDPIPADFATVDGITYASDPTRDGLGYPSTWTSYHPAGRGTEPNVMDDYWQASNPHRCRFDHLTEAWLRGRLRAKVER